ncbi:MAG: PBP1A family penicillin-binding protein [Deltaproteobacteria bacterium]|nr:PBP1A family penicillin-binding protein [Deltaproteobacteria bacterium]
MSSDNQSQILKKRTQCKEKKYFSKILGWSFRLVVLMIITGVIGLVGFYFYFSKGFPKISSLSDYSPPLITTFYADDNIKIAEFSKERRILVPFADMPEMLIQAFIAAEDSRFYKHDGVDFFSIVRAFFKNIQAGAIVQGGSTITQQVTKSFFLTPERSYKRKIKEALLAYRIDKKFSKDEILYLYLNQIYLGHGAYGVEAAAENCFGKSVKDLTLAECALLAGLPQAPSMYSPFKYPERAKERRIYVLNRMVAEGYISDFQAREAMNTQLDIKPRQNLYMEKAPYYTEYVRRYVEEKYGRDALYKDGLKVYTAVNIDMQKAARDEVEKGLRALDKRQGYRGPVKHLLSEEIPSFSEEIQREPDQTPKLQAALLCSEIGTGRVKAMVGGRDFRYSQFNRAVQSRRQPGSAFKPLIYAAALDKGYTPTTVIMDSAITFKGGENDFVWKPKNYKKKFFGPTLLRNGLIHSRNIVTIKILQDIGIDYAIAYAGKLGITSGLSRDLSIALGSSGVSLLEIVKAYSVFANLGYIVEPIFITKIVDRNGRIIEENNPEPRQVIEESTAYIMTSLLESVVKNGTGWRAKALNRPVAGKTGTTNDLFDAWFVGYTPRYITGTWVGYDDEQSLGKGETGSRAAAPIWLGFMKKALADKPVRTFQVPEDVVFSKVDAETGLLAIPESEKTIFECFKEGTVPTEFTQKPGSITETEHFFKSDM